MNNSFLASTPEFTASNLAASNLAVSKKEKQQKSALISTEELEKNLVNKLENRLSSSNHYTKKETLDIESFNHKLFPKDYVLSSSDSEQLRRLSALSRVALVPPSQIKSHRPYIGWLVVLVKKATWPLVAFHLKDTLKAMEDFCAISVENHARLLVQKDERE